jgi:hypothetical protein
LNNLLGSITKVRVSAVDHFDSHVDYSIGNLLPLCVPIDAFDYKLLLIRALSRRYLLPDRPTVKRPYDPHLPLCACGPSALLLVVLTGGAEPLEPDNLLGPFCGPADLFEEPLGLLANHVGKFLLSLLGVRVVVGVLGESLPPVGELGLCLFAQEELERAGGL